MSDCTFTNNFALANSGYGGAILGGGRLQVTNSTFSGNLATRDGGAISLPFGGNALTVSGCTFSGNSAGIDGGAIFLRAGSLAATNCTFTGNGWHEEGTVRGYYFEGAYTVNGTAICSAGVATLTNCTVAGNPTGSGGRAAISNFFGQGIQVDGTLRMSNTIVANGAGLDGPDSILDIYSRVPIVSLGHNLVGHPGSSTGWVDSDLLGTATSPIDPLLASLGYYGGPTPTMPPLPGSPALGAGSVALAVDADGNPLTTDQRGLPRVVNGAIDIGAYQKQPNATTLASSVPGAGFVTLETPAGTTIATVTAVESPPPGQRAGTGLPQNAVLPVGGFDFTVGAVTTGGTAEVVLIMPAGTQVNAYYKHDAATGRWSKFSGATFADRNGDGTPDVVLRLTDGGAGDQDGVANGIIVDPGIPAFVLPMQVQIDIKPGDSTNSTNLAGQGVISVAILSSAAFDAALVDVASVRFAGALAVQWSLQDVNGDGLLDMVLQFRTQDTDLRALYEQLLADDIDEDGVLDSNHQEATVGLTGSTTDNDLFEASGTLDLFLSGKSLRGLLDHLAAGTI